MKQSDSNVRFAKLAILLNGGLPLFLAGWDFLAGRLGANPLEFIIRMTGLMTIICLTLTLAVTPVRKLFDQSWLIRVRRMIGLCAFWYAAVHLSCYIWFDKSFDVKAVAIDVFRRPFIFFGMLGFLVMVPLAVTSTNRMIKRLGGQRWNKLHKLTYVAALAGAIHFYLFAKADTTIPTIFAGAICVLLIYRWFAAQQVTKLDLSSTGKP